MNGIFCGDWLQLPPVCQKSIFRNPYLKDYETIEKKVLNAFWNLSEEKPIPSRPELLFELHEQLRSKDEWLNYVLRCDRLGAETWEIYCFTHGLPTEHVGSWLPDRELPQCGNAACHALQTTIWPDSIFKKRCKWADRYDY